MISNKPDSAIYWYLLSSKEAQATAPQIQHQNRRREMERVIHIDPIPRAPRYHYQHLQNKQDHQDHQDQPDHQDSKVFAENDYCVDSDDVIQKKTSLDPKADVTEELLAYTQTSHDTDHKDHNLIRNGAPGVKTTPESHQNMWNSPLRRPTMLGGEAAAASGRPAQ